MGPPDQDAAWNDNALAGAHRLLSRLWTLADELGAAAPGGGIGPRTDAEALQQPADPTGTR